MDFGIPVEAVSTRLNFCPQVLSNQSLYDTPTCWHLQPKWSTDKTCVEENRR